MPGPSSSNRHSSIRSATSEKIAKLVPPPSNDAPSGYADPGQMCSTTPSVSPRHPHGRSLPITDHRGAPQETDPPADDAPGGYAAPGQMCSTTPAVSPRPPQGCSPPIPDRGATPRETDPPAV